LLNQVKEYLANPDAFAVAAPAAAAAPTAEAAKVEEKEEEKEESDEDMVSISIPSHVSDAHAVACDTGLRSVRLVVIRRSAIRISCVLYCFHEQKYESVLSIHCTGP
jgi:hypothetical protein